MVDANKEPAKNPVPDAQSTKAVTGAVVDKKDPDNNAGATSKEPPKNAVSDNTPPEVQQADPDAPELTKEEQSALERILGNDDETTDPDRPAVRKGHVPSAMTKIQRIIATIPQETPNEHVVWGAAGVQITVGDFRELCKQFA